MSKSKSLLKDSLISIPISIVYIYFVHRIIELLKNLQSIGDNFGLLYKICRDFDKIESDIKDCNKYNMNFIINDGVQETFILFMETKTQLIEKCLTLNIYTHTLKEVMDELERSVDICLASSNVDLKSNYSSVSQN